MKGIHPNWPESQEPAAPAQNAARIDTSEAHPQCLSRIKEINTSTSCLPDHHDDEAAQSAFGHLQDTEATRSLSENESEHALPERHNRSTCIWKSCCIHRAASGKTKEFEERIYNSADLSSKSKSSPEGRASLLEAYRQHCLRISGSL